MKIKTNLLQFHKCYKTEEIIIKYSVACFQEESNIINIDPTGRNKLVIKESYGTPTIEAATGILSEYDTERILSTDGGVEQNMAEQFFPSSCSHDLLGKQEEEKFKEETNKNESSPDVNGKVLCITSVIFCYLDSYLCYV